MRLIPIDKLIELQSKPGNIRNICILAHVDHGKTTLADSLVASNGIISGRMVGKMRYMDNLPEEQERGITMKSSAIALYFTNDESQYLINLIDSPGHVDFCGEVSTAVRLCDSALIVVDVVEGVCPQTHAVLRQAWKEGLKPLLVLNKLDRLILELKMTPMEMYKQLSDVLGQVNAVSGELFMSKVLEIDEKLSSEKANNDTNNNSDKNGDEKNVDEENDTLLDDEHLYFTPENGNVIFASAFDGWGFRIEDFVKIWSTKANLSEKVLRQTLWGDYYLDSKTKRIKRGAFAKGKKPLFVQMILDNVWSMYDAFVVRKDKAQSDKIVASLNLQIPARDARHQDSRIYAQSAFQQWLPLAGAVLTAVCEKTPPANKAVDEERAVRLMCGSSVSTYGGNYDVFGNFPEETKRLKTCFQNCSPDSNEPTIVLISKLFAVETKNLPAHRPKPLTAEEIQDRRRQIAEKHVQFNNQVDVTTFSDNEPRATPEEQQFTFLAFCRVFSGTLKPNQTLYVLPPTHDPSLVRSSPDYLEKLCKFQTSDMYLMMGRELESMPCVPAGNVAALAGLDDLVLKSATLSTDPMCPSFSSTKFYAEPIVRVSVEPKHASDMSALVAGLKLLNQADPCVKTYVEDTGEHVLVTAGEVHLQRCINDLQERYSKIELNVSEPIIPFMETVVPPPTLDRVNETIQQQTSDETSKQIIEIRTANKQVLFRIRSAPLPETVLKLLEKNESLLKLMDASKKLDSLKLLEKFAVETLKKLDDFRLELSEAFDSSGIKMWKGACDRIWAFGSKKSRCNVLFNNVNDYNRPNVWQLLSEGFAASSSSTSMQQCRLRDYDQSVVSGFQMRCRLGPLCEEPMRGVAFIIEDWVEHQPLMATTSENGDDNQLISKDAYGPLSGQIIACIKEGCKLAFQAQPQRLVAAMYSCVIQATTDVLGRVYAVLSKRGGRVVGEEMKEGANLFEISATLPVVESFGFCDEIRKRTSGLASPQLVFSHWEVIDIDPFWVPTTTEELSHFGEKADSENRARKYMNAVRKRKGLSTDEKIVEFGTKQRTLTIK